jgi:polyisoprenoid-binding protein YceI
MTTEKTKWVIDPAHSEIHFKVKHLVISTVTGSFEKFEGSITAPEEGFDNASIEFTAEVDSISTNQADRDGHLKSPDFFDAGQYPKVIFKSKNFKKNSETDYVLTGDLTLKNVTKEVTLNAEFGGIMKDPWGNTKAGFEVVGKINRKDFGLTWNALTETGGMVVGEDVKLQMNIELAKQ